ncbi:MAG: hypothetical protein AAF889_10690, partial [Cyanobacteria bacterium P01_D01_bin.73]
GAKREGPFFCENCRHLLVPMPPKQLESYLSPRDKKLASVKVVEWNSYYCAWCHPELDNPEFTGTLPPVAGTEEELESEETTFKHPFHLFELEQSRFNFEVCPSCNEKALEQTAVEVLRRATDEQEGEQKIKRRCRMCDRRNVVFRPILKKMKIDD